MENPILYRASRQARHQTLSQRLGLRLLYPALLLVPTAVLVLGALPRGACHFREAVEAGFAVSAFLTLGMFPLRALAATVGAFARERELQTLEPLLASRLTPADLLLGKLGSGVLPLLAEVLAFLPVWFLFWSAGVASVEKILAFQGLVLVCTLFAGALGVWASLRERTSVAAGGLAYGVIAGLLAGPPLLDLLMSLAGLHQGLLVSVFSPAMVLAAQFMPGALAWMAPTAIALYALGALWLVDSAWGRLVRRPSRPAAPRPRHLPTTGVLARWAENPILFRHALGAETRTQSPFARTVLRLVPPAILVGPTVLGTFLSGPGEFDEALTFGFFLTAFLAALYFCLGATGRGTRAVATERERKTLDGLLGSRLSSAEVVRGLAAVAVGLPLLELLCWTPALLVFTASSEVDAGHVLGFLLFAAALTAFCGTMGLWFSAGARLAIVAFRQAFGALVVLVVGTFFADLLLNDLLGGPVYLFTRANPVAGLVSVFGARLEPGLWVWTCAIYLAAAWAFLRGTAHRLVRPS